MNTIENNQELKNELKRHYNNEIYKLNNIKKTIEDLEDQIKECTNEISQIQFARIRLEDKLENKNFQLDLIPTKEYKNSSELTMLKKDFKKEIKKLRTGKAIIDKRIFDTVRKLNKSGLELSEPQKNKSFRSYIDHWINTIQCTYKEIYSA